LTRSVETRGGIYRLYGDEGLGVRTRERKRLASRARISIAGLNGRNERWYKDFVSARAADGRWFRTLTVMDDYTHENAGEFVSRAMDACAYAHHIRLELIRPCKPVEKAFIESFNFDCATSP
jgi:transposase InsO family protein